MGRKLIFQSAVICVLLSLAYSNYIMSGLKENGANCCQNVNACSPNPCQPGYSCVATTTTPCYTCQCSATTTTATCPQCYSMTSSGSCQFNNVCGNTPCSTGCTCTQSLYYPCYTCTCNPCMSNPCPSCTTCQQSGSSYTCPQTNACSPNPCQSGYTCTQTTTGCCYSCTQTSNPCQSNPCANVACTQCVQNGNSYTCQQVNYCATQSPCASNQTCSQLMTSPCYCCYGTTSHTQYNYNYNYALYKSSEFAQCTPESCSNGRCIVSNNRIVCLHYNCLDAGHECENGGICITRSNGDYVCSCRHPFCGPRCNKIAPNCQSLTSHITFGSCDKSKCNDRGTCLTTSSSFECHCYTGWLGNKCQIRDLKLLNKLQSHKHKKN